MKRRRLFKLTEDRAGFSGVEETDRGYFLVNEYWDGSVERKPISEDYAKKLLKEAFEP